MKPRIAFSDIPKDLMTIMMTTENYVSGIGFDIKLLELIRLRVSSINRCTYCIDMHFKEAIAAGEDIQRLYSVSEWKQTSYYTPEEKACLAWAEFITQPYQQHDEQSLFECLSAFFNKEQIADLTLMIIQINAWNRLMKAFGIEPGHYQHNQH